MSANDGPPDGGSHCRAKDDVAQIVPVVMQARCPDIGGDNGGRPGEAIPEVTLEHRGERKRRSRMSRWEAVVAAVRARSLHAELDHLHEHFIHNLRPHQIESEM